MTWEIFSPTCFSSPPFLTHPLPLSFLVSLSLFLLVIQTLFTGRFGMLMQVQCIQRRDNLGLLSLQVKQTDKNIFFSLFPFITCRLHFVFHQPLLHALDLVDQKNITKLITPSGRVLYQVGSKGYFGIFQHNYTICLLWQVDTCIWVNSSSRVTSRAYQS